ncbi:hypothetical protein ACRULA_31425, partial [Burkholderia pseudomallei]
MSLIPLTVWPARGRRRPDENVMRTAPFIDAPDAAIVLGPRQARPRRAAARDLLERLAREQIVEHAEL